VTRWLYNKCLDGYKKKLVKNSIKEYRQKFVNDINYENKKDFKWILDIPYDVKDGVVWDLQEAISNSKKIDKKVEMKFRKKGKEYSIVIHKKHWMDWVSEDKIRKEKEKKKQKEEKKKEEKKREREKKREERMKKKKKNNTSISVSTPIPIPTPEPPKLRKYERLFNGMRSSEPLPRKLHTDSRLIMTNLGEYYLILSVPFECKNHDSNENPIMKSTILTNKRIVSLDPGVRTFQTCYDPSGNVTEWGSGDINGIMRLLHAYDCLQSEKVKAEKRKKYKIRRSMKRIMERVKNQIEDIHRKCIKWLLENHHVILIPVFKVKELMKKKYLAKETKRKLQQWSHYRFRMRLLSSMHKYPEVKVFVVSESYTSKTCTKCGNQGEKTSSKKLHCKKCGHDTDRDIAGSRNILLKFLTEHLDHLMNKNQLIYLR
jgi:transposase